MRDPNRIYPFLNTLAQGWLQKPDLRFGQLIEILKNYSGRHDLFYVEDEDMLQIIKEYFDLDE